MAPGVQPIGPGSALMPRSCAGAEWFEDYLVGDEFLADPVTLSEDEIIAYARKYDDQPIHTDPEAAARTMHGGIIAPGSQTLAVSWGSLVDSGFLKRRSLGAPGVDDLRWHHPVRPGDTLQTRARVRATRASETRSDRGYVTFDFETTNQRGDVVMTKSITHILPRRPGA